MDTSKLPTLGLQNTARIQHGRFAGTPDYLAPEVNQSPHIMPVIILIIVHQVINQSRYNKSVDWYALGVLIF